MKIMIINNYNNNIHLYGAISNFKLLFGATNKTVDKHDELGTLRWKIIASLTDDFLSSLKLIKFVTAAYVIW